jgi:hypothetical protein
MAVLIMQALQTIFGWLLFLGVLAGFAWVCWKIDRAGIVRMRAKRDRDIEIAMRIAMQDANAQQRIARKIIHEYEE